MIYNNFYYGIGRSKYDQSSFDSMVNIDVHSTPGEAKCQLALASDSATPNEACISVEAPTGDVYFFSTTTGKTWKRTSAGVYSLVNTNANGAHSGCGYFNGYVYYSAALKLGRFDLSSTWSDSWGTFSQAATYRPMHEMNLSLFIGNGKYLSSVDSAGTFADNSLDLPSNYTITALAGVGTDLLVGTYIGANVSKCKVFLWDTYSSSWTVEDEIPEVGVNCFIPSDNMTFAQCGTSGNIYYWTGDRMEFFKKIRGITTSWNPYLSTVLNGKPLIASNTKVFSIYRSDRDLPWAIVQEYTATTGTITSILGAVGTLLVSNGSNIDKIGTAYATATIDTPESYSDKQKVIVKYDSIGSGGTVGISTNTNGGGYTDQTAITDSVKNEVYFDGGLGKTNFKQARITLTPSGANNIGIKSIEL